MRTLKFGSTLSLLALVLAFGSAGAFGQRLDGALRGVVKDSGGAVVPGATVTVTNEATGSTRDSLTSSVGTYLFPNLLVGKYTVSAELTGFKKYVRRDVRILANQVSEVNPVLELGNIETVVEVLGGAELVTTTSSQVGGSIPERAVLDMPNAVLGGDPLNLALAFPNVTSQSGGVLGEGGSVGGNRPRNNNFTIDGAR
ncbi:MAG: hypothetical protein DMG07_28215 [Acidobacteria bacterium]|nr:MAG: hypothetical protein DMG07_28215 [Acidobacteriota bacterium]